MYRLTLCEPHSNFSVAFCHFPAIWSCAVDLVWGPRCWHCQSWSLEYWLASVEVDVFALKSQFWYDFWLRVTNLWLKVPEWNWHWIPHGLVWIAKRWVKPSRIRCHFLRSNTFYHCYLRHWTIGHQWRHWHNRSCQYLHLSFFHIPSEPEIFNISLGSSKSKKTTNAIFGTKFIS